MKTEKIIALKEYAAEKRRVLDKLIEDTEAKKEKLDAETAEAKKSFVRRVSDKAVKLIAENEVSKKAYDELIAAAKQERDQRQFRYEPEYKALAAEVIEEARTNEAEARKEAEQIVNQISEHAAAIEELSEKIKALNAEKSNYCVIALEAARLINDPEHRTTFGGGSYVTEPSIPVFGGVNLEQVYSVNYAGVLRDRGQIAERIKSAINGL